MACSQPILVCVHAFRRVYQAAGVGGAKLCRLSKWVRLQRLKIAVCADDLVFINVVGRKAGDENLPNASIMELAHDVATSIPIIERSNHRHPLGRRGPDGKGKAFDMI